MRSLRTLIADRRMLLVLGLTVLSSSCGDGEREEGASAEGAPDTVEEATLDEEGAEEAPPGRGLAALPVTFRQGADGFAHDSHQEIACTRCHDAIEGHATHQAVACSECHDVPEASEAGALPSRAECLSCHHRPRPDLTCSRCHETEGMDWIHVSQRLDVASSTRSRELPFLHDGHDGVECRSCHTGGPSLQVERACSSCHEEHHRQEAECMTCHASVPLETHDLGSHEGCAGSGCHEDPGVPALDMTRNVCLACHQDQVDHERGQDCASCHLVANPRIGQP